MTGGGSGIDVDARAHPDVLIPFAGVDPHLGRAAVREVHRLVDEQGVRGFKHNAARLLGLTRS